MVLKKMVSFLIAVSIIATSFAGAVMATEELDFIAVSSVTETVLYDNAGEKTELYSDYDVTASKVGDAIKVSVITKDLKKHTNADASPEEGYWTGFAVIMPEGAEKVSYVFGDTNSEGVKPIDGIVFDGKIPFYVNAGSKLPKTNAKLQWFDGDNNPLTKETEFVIDLSGVTLDCENEYTYVAVEANVKDSTDPTREVYASYNIDPTNADNGAILVDIDMTKLELHKNGEGDNGFWTGFAVAAPVGAENMKYTFGDKVDEYAPIETSVANRNDGVAFYTDAAAPITYAKLQWFDAEDNALSNPVEFEINLDGVEYYKVDAENDITEAILKDNAAEPVTTLFDEYEVNAEGEGVINVAISAENVVKHENEGNTPGYWVGFAVKAPSEDATKANINFGEDIYANEPVVDIDGNGTKGIAFYINAGDAQPKTEATLQWLDEKGETLSDVTTFEIDLDGVTLDVIDYTPEIVKANIADYDEVRSVYDADSYIVTPTTKEDGTILVDVAMQELAEHTNGEIPAKEGFWTGFAVEAAPGATQFKYAFGADKETLVWEEGLSGLLHGLEDIDGAEGEKVGVAFITDANNTPKKYAMLQWFDADNNAVTDVVEFEMNLDDVKLNWIKAEDVSEAVLDDTADVVETLYTTHTVEKQQTDETITVKLLTKDLAAHQNDDTPQSIGYWTGFAVNVPAEATHIKYTFDKESDVEWSSATTIPVEGYVVDGKFPLYTNAGATEPKLYAQLQWLKDGAPLCAPTKFVIDISGVTFAGLDYIAADEVKPAKIVDQANVTVQPYGTYSVSSTSNADGSVVVADIDMTDLKSHESIGEGAGHWTGFAIAAPAEATHMKVVFDTEANIDWNNASYEATEPSVVGDDDGVAFYTKANASEPKKVAMLQWYNGSEPISNITTIKMDISGVQLYVAPSPSSPRGGGSGGSNYYTVNFNSNGGSTVASAKAKKEAAISAPAVPVKDGFVFDGWYTDKELTQKYDFSTPVTKSFTLYAKWTKAESETTGLKFTDIKKDAWYYDVVKTIVEKGLMNGISETEFAPELEVTRAMFVTILYRAAGEPEVEEAASFTDVSADTYYAKAVAWASSNGIVNGITESEFAPDNNITREQMAVMLYRYKKAEKADKTAKYTDENSISEYALDAINWANAEGIMTGNEDGSFAPLRNSSRAEAAAVFVRLLNLN